jgi:hypothetical protein
MVAYLLSQIAVGFSSYIASTTTFHNYSATAAAVLDDAVILEHTHDDAHTA